ncbi:MAG TPA: choice-of-anchor V domain-containing protein [Bryobacteraceae bacterium]|nr:choice-of-anchor V domain-containing protein [Bryobacteraceae bacterium]
MKRKVSFPMTRFASLALLAFLPTAVFAESATPSLGYTGAPTDHGGQNCITCHTGNPLNDPSGSLQVTATDYVPNVQQSIHVVVQNANASRFGFQITIREQSDQTQSSGSFALAESNAPVQVVCDDGTQFGSQAPCSSNIARQFAEHLNAPRGATGAAYEFDVIWTPPAQEIGRLQLYVAAVAANGDGTPQGDHVYTYAQALANAGGCDLVVKPVFQKILNGASFQPGFSSGAMVSIFGSGFQTSGRQRTAGLGDYVNGAYPTELGCAAVEVTGPGLAQPVQLPISYVSPGQINAQMPEFSGTGTVTLTVLINPGVGTGVSSAVATLNSLQPFAPAFFVFANSTSIAAEEAATGSLVANSSVVTGAAPAKPGDIVSLFATGFGDANPFVPSGQLATGVATLVNQVTVTIGTTTLAPSDVLYAGLSPGSISGLYQFNVRIPAGTPSGNVPVSITIGGVSTQSGVTIPVQ